MSDKRLPDNDNLTMMDILGARDEWRKEGTIPTLSAKEIRILNETTRKYDFYQKHWKK